MLKDVTLGRYYPVPSVLHSLDPRTKLAAVLAYIVTTFLVSSPAGIAVTFLFLCILIMLSGVPLGYMLKGLRPVFMIVLVVDLVDIFIVGSSIWKSVLVTVRMVEIVLGSNILGLTTKPRTMADGVEKALGWMKVLHVPVHDIATMISIAFRFIPILTLEADRVMEAQKSRGADFETGNLVRRAKALVPVLVPLFVSAFRRADELALAMDSRLYGSGRSTRLHPLEYSSYDCAAYLLLVAYVGLVVLVRMLGI